MRNFYFLCLLLFSACHDTTFVTYKPPLYDKISDEITLKTAQKIKNETGLLLCGTGGGSAENHLRKLNMCFDRYDEITMEEGRELLIYCVNEYLSAINASEELRPDLIHYPFTPKDVEIIIYIRDSKNHTIPMGALYTINANGGRLNYKIKKPDPIISERIHQETYEEAVKIIESSKTTCRE